MGKPGRPFGKLNGNAEAVVRLTAQGVETDEIMRRIFGIDPETIDAKEKNKLAQQIWRWRHHPGANAVWQDEVNSIIRRCVPKAMTKLEKQITDDNGWLSNKASNDFLTLAKSAGVLQSEDKAIKVQIEGMPEIGSPDDNG